MLEVGSWPSGVADYFGVEQLISRHRVARDKADAAKQSLEAGVDLELPDPDSFPELLAMARDGRVAESTIDRAVARVLTAKFLAGLFDDPYVKPEEAERVTNTTEHQALALEAPKIHCAVEERSEPLAAWSQPDEGPCRRRPGW
jgi:beta-glucosidase